MPINTTLLEDLRLVQPSQWSTIERRARRIARGLPLVESVWIDAMLQLGHVTPYQAKRLQEHDAKSLQVGSYVILDRRESLGWADCFDAYRIDDRRRAHLAVIKGVLREAWEPLRAQLAAQRMDPAQNTKKIPDTFSNVDDVGIDDRLGVWIASPPCQGESVARWMVQHGRLSPTVVLEIARQMARALSQLESQQQTHGDLRAATLFLDATQGIKLILPGVRAVVRPRESFAETAGPIDMYDGLSPERAAEGTVPDVKSDLFAAGSLWWQMLAGRSPMPGGDGRAKLSAAARRNVDDIRKHAADVPEPLVQAITACTAQARDDRPNSFREVLATLGESDSRGAKALRRSLRGTRATALPVVSAVGMSRQARYLGRAIVAAGILVAIVALGLAADRFFHPPQQKVAVLPKPQPQPQPSKKPPAYTVIPAPVEESTELTESKTLVLDSDKPITAESLAALLKPGLKVTSRPGRRVQVLIHSSPLQIKCTNVHFEGIDFVTSKPDETEPSGVPSSDTPTPAASRAMIELRESEATFIGCTFHDHHAEKSQPRTVLHWIFPDASTSPDPQKLQTTLPNSRLVFENCVWDRETGTALHAEVHAAVALELRNVLHLGVGPMLFLETPPKPDEPWLIRADRVTLRESGPFWACRYTSTRAGTVRIEANYSVFAPKGTQPLLLFVGENDPEPIFRQMEWTGRGTLVTKATPTAAWQDNRGNREPLNDQQASIDGLVRSQIEFIGPADDTSASSVLQTWDAPLTTDTPPGIDAKQLPAVGQGLP